VSIVCPNGHPSGTADYCDTCGAAIAVTERTPPAPDELEPSAEELEDQDTSTAARQIPCPVCNAARSGDDRYCEGCGHDFHAPPPIEPAWEVVAVADRSQFDRLAAAGISFPDGSADRRFLLDADEMRIGRSKGRAGEVSPEIDLAGPSEDPGISHLHAVLERQPDGRYAVRDLGSTNGTTVNDQQLPSGASASVMLGDGDRIRIGAWTAITIRSR
jgi:hypothetical protein